MLNLFSLFVGMIKYKYQIKLYNPWYGQSYSSLSLIVWGSTVFSCTFVSCRGVANLYRIKQDFIFSLVQLKEGVQPLMIIQAMHNDTSFLLNQL